MSTESFVSKDLLYVLSGSMSEKQLKLSLDNALTAITNSPKNKIQIDYVGFDYNKSCRYRINVVKKRSGENVGYSFIWLSDPAVFNMLNGFNPDGSVQFDDKTSNWADMEDSDSLMTMFTDQSEAIRLSPCSVKMPEEKYNSNVMYCKSCPNWITIDDIRNYFSDFSSNPNYPIVTVTRGRVKSVFVTFDPNTKDALFAYNMGKITNIFKNGKNTTLPFSFAYLRN